MIVLGELSLWIALLMASWCATVSIAGGMGKQADLIRSGERAARAAFVFTALASAGLWTGLLSRDFSLAYVAGQISANVPDYYVFAAFWSGPAGSMLLWALILALYTVLTGWWNRTTNRELMPFVTGTLGVVLALVLATAALEANPFARLDLLPLDGRGMHPQLQNPGMVTHPPTLYLGLVATTVPFAFAISALASRRLDAQWLAAVRRWALVSWFFLTVGIVLGMWWAYVEPGRSGYWALDPIQGSSLLPWLIGTAFLLSTASQEKRGMVRKWNVVLLVVAFLFSIPATVITRVGTIDSVHSFSRSPAGGLFWTFLVGATVAAASLVATRLPDPEARADLDRNASRNRRRYGRYMVYAGIFMLFAAFAGQAFRREFHVSLTAGQAFEATDAYGRAWRFVSQGVSASHSLNREVTTVALEASRDGKPAGLITSEKRQYFDSQLRPTFEPSTEVGIRADARQDVYVVLAEVHDDVAELRITFNPLMLWVWIGGAMLALGGLAAMLPPATRSHE